MYEKLKFLYNFTILQFMCNIKIKKKSVAIIMIALICMSFTPHAFAMPSNETRIDDWDNDGIPDLWERENLLNPYCPKDAALDFNHDGLTAFQEFENNIDPWNVDVDGDEITNYAETTGLFGFYTDPFERDTDNDGLIDLIELSRHIDLLNTIHMAQLYPNIIDRQEVKTAVRIIRNRHLFTLSPINWDTDGDGISDGYEIQIGSNPLYKDTDRDGLGDGREVLELKTNPLLKDSDKDGIVDSIELIGIDRIKYNPLKWDTDGNGISDGEEAFGFGLAPIKPAKHAISYKNFLRGDHAGEYVTLMARVSRFVENYTSKSYQIYLKSLNEENGILSRSAVANVKNEGHYELIKGERIFVDNRFGFSLEMGDLIVITGKSGNTSRGTRSITVGDSGSIYLILGLEEAQNRWLPSREYVRVVHIKPSPPEIEPLTQEEILESLLNEKDEKIRELNEQLYKYRLQLDELKRDDIEVIVKDSDEKIITDRTIFDIPYMHLVIGVGSILLFGIVILVLKLKFNKIKKSNDDISIDDKISSKILNQSEYIESNQSDMTTIVEKIGDKIIYR